MSLPALLVLTDRHQAARLGLVATVAEAVAGGARAVVLREKDLTRGRREELAYALQAVLAPVGGVLLIAGADVALARATGAAGVHLAGADPWPGRHPDLLIGRSCHHRAEVQASVHEGADYATVSPVLASRSKPGYGPVLGMAGLARLAGASDLALFALGGVSEASAGDCIAAGAAGVAVMGTVMSSPEPARIVARLLVVLSGSSVEAGAR
ncbi:MAG: thiamine phosphate synthase [Actinomycetota bacterium]|nr:thiamine phosphate synthase [Actinomycetota bacterium]